MLGHGILVERSHDFALKGSREGHAQVVFEPGAGEEKTRDRCVQRIGGTWTPIGWRMWLNIL